MGVCCPSATDIEGHCFLMEEWFMVNVHRKCNEINPKEVLGEFDIELEMAERKIKKLSPRFKEFWDDYVVHSANLVLDEEEAKKGTREIYKRKLSELRWMELEAKTLDPLFSLDGCLDAHLVGPTFIDNDPARPYFSILGPEDMLRTAHGIEKNENDEYVRKSNVYAGGRTASQTYFRLTCGRILYDIIEDILRKDRPYGYRAPAGTTPCDQTERDRRIGHLKMCRRNLNKMISDWDRKKSSEEAKAREKKEKKESKLMDQQSVQKLLTNFFKSDVYKTTITNLLNIKLAWPSILESEREKFYCKAPSNRLPSEFVQSNAKRYLYISKIIKNVTFSMLQLKENFNISSSDLK